MVKSQAFMVVWYKLCISRTPDYCSSSCKNKSTR